MSIVLHQVDSFTDRPFAGNPAGVCILEEFGDEEWLQSVAREMNLSETAFLVRRDDAFLLRWFTPAAEVDLCGHATLAAGHVLWEEGHLAPGDPARFDTRSGRLVATRQGDLIEMDFPAAPPATCDPPEILVSALGSEPSLVARNRLDYLALFDSEDALRAISPNFRDLRELGGRGVMITSPSGDDRYDFVSRYFAPAFGIDEDPVTGSAHCCLGPFWQERLGRDAFTAFQASARGGVVRVRVAGDRVILGGYAVTVLRGTLAEAATPAGVV